MAGCLGAVGDVIRPEDLRAALDGLLDEYEERAYLGMSALGQCPRKLYDDLVRGRTAPDLRGRRLFHEGYLHEADVVRRLQRAGIAVHEAQPEVVAEFDARLRGHVDGRLCDGSLLEVKSVYGEKFYRIVREGAPGFHRAQVQAYMRWGGYPRAWIVYKNRENGDLWMVLEMRDGMFGDALERKARAILAAVDGRKGLPPCECGRCQGQVSNEPGF